MSETEVVEAAVQTGRTKRGGFINVTLALLAVSGLVLVIVLYLLFFIIEMDLLGDPEPVWAQTPWFIPQVVLVVLLFQTLLFGLQAKPWKAPAVWCVMASFVAIIFNGVAAFFYFRLFIKCVGTRGTFEPLEAEICNDRKDVLYTLAWFNILFIFHAVISLIVCALVYTNDARRVTNLKEKYMSLRKGIFNKLGKIKDKVGKLGSISIKQSSMKMMDKDDSEFITSILKASMPLLNTKITNSGKRLNYDARYNNDISGGKYSIRHRNIPSKHPSSRYEV